MESFTNIPDWITEVSKYTPEDTLKILLVNKSDIDSEAADGGKRQVSKEILDKFTEETGIKWIETSAKTGMNVDEAFIHLTKQLIEKKAAETPPED